jgi:uncharacterized damage-inducible protein DinB
VFVSSEGGIEEMVANSMALKPVSDEYADYYGKYVDLVSAGSIVETLEQQMKETQRLLSALTDEQASYRYAPDKWSIKQLIGHLIDGEHIFAYRALRFARGDRTPLPGFEQDDYVTNGDFDDVSIEELVRALANIRAASVDFFGQLSEEAWDRRGIANDSEVSVRAIAWIIAGHELHHRRVIETRYLNL